MWVPVSPHPRQWLLSVFFVIGLVGMKWYLIVVLICISLLASGHLHIFFGERSVQIICSFFSWIIYHLIIVRVLCIYYIQAPYKISDLQRFLQYFISFVFLLSWWCLFSEAQKFLILMKFSLSIFSSITCVLPSPGLQGCMLAFSSCISSKNYRVSGRRPTLDSQLSQHRLLNTVFSPLTELSWYTYWKSVDRKCKGLFLDS